MNKNRLRKKPLSVRQRLAYVNSMKPVQNEVEKLYGFGYANLFSNYDLFYMAEIKKIDMSPCSMLKKILTPKYQD